MPDKRKAEQDFLGFNYYFKKALYLPLHCLEYELADHFHIRDLQMTVSWSTLFPFSLLPKESKTRKENILDFCSQVSL